MRHAQDVWRRYHSLIGAAVGALLILVCYGFVLRLPFFLDDLPIMTWLSRHNWMDIWTRSSENQFYRPLAFTIYKVGRLLPSGADRTFLHGVSLFIHWVSAMLIMQLVMVTGRSPEEGLVASILFIAFPFLFMAVPWITAMSHPLVTMLTLLATFSALKAEGDRAVAWWGVSLLATVLAPLAHESGQVCAAIVGGYVLIQHGLRSRRRVLVIILGGLLNVGMMILRGYVPGVGEPTFVGAEDWVQNALFFLHGLTYPVAPIIGWLVRRHSAQDLTLVAVAAAFFLFTLAWLVVQRGTGRWAASGLWWWGWSALPAGLSLRYGYLYSSPRVYTLAAAATVMLWSHVVFGVTMAIKKDAVRRALVILFVGLIVTQSVTFLRRQAKLFSTLNDVYQEVLEAASNRANTPIGFVNLPKALAYPDRTYAMIQETVLFAPPYSNITEFIEVNADWRQADAVMYTPVLEEANFVFGFQGQGLDWKRMRQFAVDHRSVWLARWQAGDLALDRVGSIDTGTVKPDHPLVRFENGVVIESCSADHTKDGEWAVEIVWGAQSPTDARIFVHVHDARGKLVAQADGPALGGMIPPWIWRDGDRIYDIRHVSPNGSPPYSVQVGLFRSAGRIPAYTNGVRSPDDAPEIVRLVPQLPRDRGSP